MCLTGFSASCAASCMTESCSSVTSCWHRTHLNMQIVSSPLLCTVVLLLFLSFRIIYLLLRHSGSRCQASALSSGNQEIRKSTRRSTKNPPVGFTESCDTKKKTHDSVQAQPCKDARAKRQKAANSREPSEAETGGSRNRCGRFCISSCFALKKGNKKKKKNDVKKFPFGRGLLSPHHLHLTPVSVDIKGGNLESCL